MVLHQLNLEEQWRREAPESPLVTSRPPKTVRLGETLRYQIETVSKSGKPVFKLDSGPEGMVLSESGLLEWTPAVLPQSGKASAVISVADSGQSKFHAITVAVQPPEEIVVSADQGPPAGALSGRLAPISA